MIGYERFNDHNLISWVTNSYLEVYRLMKTKIKRHTIEVKFIGYDYLDEWIYRKAIQDAIKQQINLIRSQKWATENKRKPDYTTAKTIMRWKESN